MSMGAEDLEGQCQNREKIPNLIVKTVFLAAPTTCNMSCTFDVDFCEWEQATSDNFDWTRHKGPTPTPNTGPSHDHTTGGRNSRQYVDVFLLEEGKEPLLMANLGHVFPRLNPEPSAAVRICCGVDEHCRTLSM